MSSFYEVGNGKLSFANLSPPSDEHIMLVCPQLPEQFYMYYCFYSRLCRPVILCEFKSFSYFMEFRTLLFPNHYSSWQCDIFNIKTTLNCAQNSDHPLNEMGSSCGFTISSSLPLSISRICEQVCKQPTFLLVQIDECHCCEG